MHNSTQLDLDLERHLLAPFVPHGLQNTHTRVRDDLAIAQADKLTHQTTMKLLVALALAVQVSSSATDGPDILSDCEAENVSECAPLYDCTQFSGVCLVFDDCLVKPDDSLTEAECKAKNVGEPGNFATTRWCR